MAQQAEILARQPLHQVSINRTTQQFFCHYHAKTGAPDFLGITDAVM